jgi:hypothetical protein
MRLPRLAVFLAVAASACGAIVYVARQAITPAPVQLASYAPQGALLSIESPDFAGLLKSWTSSKEEQRWLGSDDFGSFSRSRLFSRLSDAQDQFAATAGLPPDARFVRQIAGGESLLAWYDIGNLQFLYITRMAPGEAQKTPLLQLSSKFEQRKVGDTMFFVRTQGDPQRTVAFAVRGDYLLLATRADLLAGALQLMQQPSDRTLLTESWYSATSAAAARKPGDLRMALNLTKIVPSPYFRSYWVQQNVTQMKQYSAALSDFDRGEDAFNEQRVLLSANVDQTMASSDLAPVLAYAPKNAGFYRATAQPGTQKVLAELQDNLLDRLPAADRNTHTAPAADLSTPATGDEAALEERIDDPVVPTTSQDTQTGAIGDLLGKANVQAMLVYEATDPPGATAEVLAPVHSAVVLAGSNLWDVPQLQHAITTVLSAKLSVSASGLQWSAQQHGSMSWSVLDGLQGITVAVQGKTLVLASDEATMLRLLDAAQHASQSPRVATTISGFDHMAEQPRFVAMSRMLDNYHPVTPPKAGTVSPFLAGNMVSLSDTFQDLDSETFTESSGTGNIVHQIVVYQWHH